MPTSAKGSRSKKLGIKGGTRGAIRSAAKAVNRQKNKAKRAERRKGYINSRGERVFDFGRRK